MFNEPFTPDKTQIFEDIHATIDLLYITQCRATKNALLNRLRHLFALLTTVPYPGTGSRVIPVDQAPELPAPSWAQVMQQEPQMMTPGQGPQTMTPQPGPQQAAPPQGAAQPREMREIPPYIPQGMHQGMQPGLQMPPSGSMQRETPGPSGMRPGGGRPQAAPQQSPAPAQQARPRTEELKSFTLDEISKYDGKGNNPAYVAVNGMVYDVTDQPGWAAGSHFGLRAGLDQTGAYISCHTGQPMIDRLKVIGRLVK